MADISIVSARNACATSRGAFWLNMIADRRLGSDRASSGSDARQRTCEMGDPFAGFVQARLIDHKRDPQMAGGAWTEGTGIQYRDTCRLIEAPGIVIGRHTGVPYIQHHEHARFRHMTRQAGYLVQT